MRPISILVLALLLLPVRQAAAGGRSHIGIAPGQIVSLLSGTTLCPGAFTNSYAIEKRALADGSLQSFTIPDGMALVVTDLIWAQSGVTPSVLWPIGLSSSPGGHILNAGAMADGAGSTRGSEHLTAGIVVKAGRTLCVSTSNGRPIAQVLGYLVRMR